jgi:hypothetical protein
MKYAQKKVGHYTSLAVLGMTLLTPNIGSARDCKLASYLGVACDSSHLRIRCEGNTQDLYMYFTAKAENKVTIDLSILDGEKTSNIASITNPQGQIMDYVKVLESWGQQLLAGTFNYDPTDSGQKAYKPIIDEVKAALDKIDPSKRIDPSKASLSVGSFSVPDKTRLWTVCDLSTAADPFSKLAVFPPAGSGDSNTTGTATPAGATNK